VVKPFTSTEAIVGSLLVHPIIAPGIVPFVPKISPGIKPPAPKYPSGEIVQINLSKYCAVELLNALIVALGIVPPGKKGKKGKKP